ncbi:MAG: hypothetical protein Ct9H90mP27_4540 [Gammaproteobacteria bacterium]|nr:MAG: hypothetical protein Ct9H90mP27_4540 [Gammaproteobacteria bacterium]
MGESSGQAFSFGDAIRVKIASVGNPGQGKLISSLKAVFKRKKRGKSVLAKPRRRGSAH